MLRATDGQILVVNRRVRIGSSFERCFPVYRPHQRTLLTEHYLVTKTTSTKMQRPMGKLVTIQLHENEQGMNMWNGRRWITPTDTVWTDQQSATTIRRNEAEYFGRFGHAHSIGLALYERPDEVVSQIVAVLQIDATNRVYLQPTVNTIGEGQPVPAGMAIVLGFPKKLNWSLTLLDHTMDRLTDVDVWRYRPGTPLDFPRLWVGMNATRRRHMAERATMNDRMLTHATPPPTATTEPPIPIEPTTVAVANATTEPPIPIDPIPPSVTNTEQPNIVDATAKSPISIDNEIDDSKVPPYPTLNQLMAARAVISSWDIEWQ